MIFGVVLMPIGKSRTVSWLLYPYVKASEYQQPQPSSIYMYYASFIKCVFFGCKYISYFKSYHKEEIDAFVSECKFCNSSSPSAAYMRQWIRSALLHIMACRLFGAKPLSKPMPGYCRLYPYEQTSTTFVITIQNYSFTKMHLNISSAKWRPFCLGKGGLTRSGYSKSYGDINSSVVVMRNACG